MIAALADELGSSDCEALAAGALAQPVNAWSSLAYVVAGLLVVTRSRRAPRGSRWPHVVYGLTVASVGVGSVAFHGPQPPGSRLVHDLSIAAVLAFVAAYDFMLIRGRSLRDFTAALVGAVGLLGVLFAAVPDASIAATIPVAGAAIIGEWLVWRRHLRPHVDRDSVMRTYAVIGGVVAVAAVLNVLGRTDGPLCDPDSGLQLHGLWHLMTAAAFGLWGAVTLPAEPARVADQEANE